MKPTAYGDPLGLAGSPGEGSVRAGLRCPACGTRTLAEVLHWASVPTNTVIFYESPEDAAGSPRGSFRLTLCERCGFLFNADHRPGLTEYSERYVETQAFSPRHREFAEGLAKAWIERHKLHEKLVLEIGPGHGADFLRMFTELSRGDAIGIGPSCSLEPIAPQISLISDYFDDRWAALPGDAVICRHTLEHIADVGSFLASLRKWGERHPGAVYLFELPDTTRLLRDVAFWDLNYEHCSYFTKQTLATTFAAAGFTVERCELAYDGQYIVLEARLGGTKPDRRELQEQAAQVRQDLDRFIAKVEVATAHGQKRLKALAAEGPLLFWQASAKAVGMLRSLAGADSVAAVVDANPWKHGLHLAGSGQLIISSGEIANYKPSHIVYMNRIYRDEIQAELRRQGLDIPLTSANELIS